MHPSCYYHRCAPARTYHCECTYPFCGHRKRQVRQVARPLQSEQQGLLFERSRQFASEIDMLKANAKNLGDNTVKLQAEMSNLKEKLENVEELVEQLSKFRADGLSLLELFDVNHDATNKAVLTVRGHLFVDGSVKADGDLHLQHGRVLVT